MVDGQKAGLCHYSKSYAMVGVRQSGKDRNLEFHTNKEKITGPAIKGNKVWIKSVRGSEYLAEKIAASFGLTNSVPEFVIKRMLPN